MERILRNLKGGRKQNIYVCNNFLNRNAKCCHGEKEHLCRPGRMPTYQQQTSSWYIYPIIKDQTMRFSLLQIGAGEATSHEDLLPL